MITICYEENDQLRMVNFKSGNTWLAPKGVTRISVHGRVNDSRVSDIRYIIPGHTYILRAGSPPFKIDYEIVEAGLP